MKQLKLSKRCNHSKLIDFGFKKSGLSYKMSVPLYKRNGETMISADFLVSCLDNYIGFDVMDVCNKTLYSTFYDTTFQNRSDVLLIVKKSLESVLEEMANENIIQKRGLKFE